MRVIELEIAVAASLEAEMTRFYAEGLGFELLDASRLRIGESELRFTPREDAEPFYHFAFLLPGDRLTPALAWLETRVALLMDPETTERTFDFSAWDALAWYCHDPAGNIVEFIGHRDLDMNGRRGSFAPEEIVGISEVGLVCRDKRRTAALLKRELGLSVWSGDLGDPKSLAFVGERGRTLILSPAGRGWMPTGRPAAIHPARVTVATQKNRSSVAVDSQTVIGEPVRPS